MRKDRNITKEELAKRYQEEAENSIMDQVNKEWERQVNTNPSTKPQEGR